MKNYFENKERAKEQNTPHPKYVPQYVQQGLAPQQHKGAVVSGTVLVSKGSKDNPRDPKLPIRPITQPYAITEDHSIGKGKGVLPNVGNSMEHSWSGVVDDIGLDTNHPMIDNNDYVSDAALGIKNQHLTNNVSKSSVSSSLQEDEYLLFVSDEPICSGSFEEVQSQVQKFIFGEHELCNGIPTPIDSIMVLKRVKIKVGVFLD